LHELIAGAAGQQLRLALEKRFPHGMLLDGVLVPALIDGPIRALGASSFACCGSVLRDFECLCKIREDKFSRNRAPSLVVMPVRQSAELLLNCYRIELLHGRDE